MSFRLKTILGIAIIELILLSALIFISLNLLQETNYESLKQKSNDLADVFSTVIKNSVISYDLATLDETVKELASRKGLVFVNVKDADNIIIASHSADSNYRSEIYEAKAKITEGGIEFGEVHVGFKTNYINELISDTQTKFAFIAAIELILTGLFSFALGTYLTKQLSGLQKASLEISKGNFGYQVKVKGNDDISKTVETFNEMSNKVKGLYDVMETKIEARTKELRKALKTSQLATKAKSEFLANMSHEIRTPMNGVLGMLSLLRDSSLTREQKEFTNTAYHSAETLLSILNDILDFSKIEAGKLVLEEVDFNLHGTIHEVCELMATSAHSKSIEIAYNIDSRVPNRTIGDPIRLRQILTNLISNAIKFTEKGEVVISVRIDNKEPKKDITSIYFEIKDTGVGIDSDSQVTIFESFSQADTSTTRKYGGTGLGLSICHQLINIMHGEINVDSAPGIGSTFYFTIPFRNSHTQEIFDNTNHNLNAKILIVDDNKTNIMICEKLLDSWSMEHHSCFDAISALALIRNAESTGKQFDIILIDMMMPGMNGLQLIEKIRSNKKFDNIKLVMLTSSIQDNNFKKAFENGVDAYHTKPVRPTTLNDTIIQLLNIKKINELNTDNKESFNHTNEIDKHQQFTGNILAVEDNFINQKVIKEILKKWGLNVDVVDNGREAIKACNKKDYNIIFMDCQMPVLDGYEATKIIRSSEGVDKHRIIIAMTANAMEGDKERCLTAGMDDYLSKPIDIKSVHQVLEKWQKDSNLAHTES